ncbi:MAG: UDP-glucose/GDP-mannose dehydrogenase family protein [Hahellaceae bacterium]|nr:UDP-glucose/GDP-mannose dehydrogenase family protein [Hahellaceae bacterium]MCP5168933.1 UDP-glucose/GDP-mannose dehydrogenase family protein [Hahellaceae bacterium]
MEISIFGLGYVGTVCGACLAKSGHRIVGVDVSDHKVELINSGRAPIVEAGLPELIAEVVEAGRLSASQDSMSAVLETEVSIVCVGTPSRDDGSLDTRYLEQVCHEIGTALKEKADYHLVVIRSTILPGAVMEVLLPILERESGKKAGVDFGLAMNPEFLRESTAIADFYEPEMTVIGEFDKRSGDILENLYAGIEAPIVRQSIEVAEMIKYTCNVWHATKVSFANEIGSIAKAVGVDGRTVMKIVCEDKKLNISSYYMRPGFAFGGSCLPKDVRALTHLGRHLDVEMPLLDSLMESNKSHITKGYKLISSFGKKKIGFFGISFKAGTDDLRESPLVDLVEKLYGKGYQIKIYDKNVDYARLHGANRDYIEYVIPHVSNLLNSDMSAVIDHAEIIVIGNPAEEFKTLVQQQYPDKIVVDLVGFMEGTTDAFQNGICW